MRDTRRTRVLLAVLLVTSFLLITVDVRSGARSPVATLRAAAIDVVGPVQLVAAAVVNPVARGVEQVRNLGDSDAELERLRRDNDALRLELRTSEVTRARAAELDGLLNVAGLGQYRVVPARVIALGAAQGFSSTVTIDAGSRDGLTQDMAVVNGQGLVGRIKTLGLLTATVLVVDDPTFAVGVRAEGTLEAGFAIGGGRGPMELTMLNPQVSLDVGDRLVTRGSRDNAPFAPGIPVGEVASLGSSPGTLTRVGTVTPFVNVEAIELVGVIVEPPRENPRDSVLPPRPPLPAPTPSPAPVPVPVPVPMPGTAATPGSAGAPSPGSGAADGPAPAPPATPAPVRTPVPDLTPAPTLSPVPTSVATAAAAPTPVPTPGAPDAPPTSPPAGPVQPPGPPPVPAPAPAPTSVPAPAPTSVPAPAPPSVPAPAPTSVPAPAPPSVPAPAPAPSPTPAPTGG